MYKGTSQNEQSRSRRSTTNRTKNTAGIDPKAFSNEREYHDVRRGLSLAKKEAEGKISVLNRQISIARRRHTFNESGQVDSKTMARWEAERSNLAAKITDLDRTLTESKIYGIGLKDDDTKTFAEEFKAMAKELLAGDVYNRIISATIHRMGERAEPNP